VEGYDMRTLIRCAVLSFFVFGVVNTVMGADTEKKGKPSCLFHMDSMKDAKFEVTNTPDGVIIKITSDKPDVVKQIQETTTQCHEAHQSGDHKNMCPMKKDSTAPCHKEQEQK
jgi:TusA-related sulfurtransferase